ncbi:MAG: hypothetical protein E7617_07405 [Ruminococcaceae bacterium]|nr:hypothetical protein [Oscillospiraceae bacterium]
MENMTLVKLFETCQKEGSLAPIERMLAEHGNGNSDGKAVKLVLYRDDDGEVKMNILKISDYRDLDKMTLAQLKSYLKELERKSDMIDDAEPDDENSPEYLAWEAASDEIDDEIYRVEDKIERLEG